MKRNGSPLEAASGSCFSQSQEGLINGQLTWMIASIGHTTEMPEKAVHTTHDKNRQRYRKVLPTKTTQRRRQLRGGRRHIYRLAISVSR